MKSVLVALALSILVANVACEQAACKSRGKSFGADAPCCGKLECLKGNAALGPRDVEQLRPAMDEMTRLTNQCVRFVERTTESNHVKTGPGFGCASDIGRIGGVQTVSLAMACLFEMGDIQHELMHVLGFYHEHARVDRDNYVTVKWENIIPAQRSQFIKKNSFTFGLPYDYDSVMHYSSDAFAKDIQLTTLTSKTSPDRKQLGQHKNLSLLDVERIKKRYGCHASPGSGTGLKG